MACKGGQHFDVIYALMLGKEPEILGERSPQLMRISRVPNLALVPGSKAAVDHPFGYLLKRVGIGVVTKIIGKTLEDELMLPNCT